MEMEQGIDTGQTPVNKKKRGKSDDRKIHDKLHVYSTVQLKLKTVLQPYYGEQIQHLLEYCSFNISRVVYEAWILAEMHVLCLLQEGKPLPDLNQSFFKSCCVNVSDTKRGGGDDELRYTSNVYRSLRPSSWEIPGNEAMSQLMSTASQEMETAFVNHVTLNLFGRLKRYVRLRYNLKNSTQSAWFIMSCFRDPEDMLTWDQKEFKEWIGKSPLEDVHPHIPHFIGKMYEMLKYYDSLDQATKGKRSFSLLPKKNGYGMAFIHLDESTLPQLLTLLDVEVQQAMIQTLALQVTPGSDENVFLNKHSSGFVGLFYINKQVSHALWHLVFDTQGLETCNRKFCYRVSTDGYGATIYLQRPKPVKPTKKIKDDVDYSHYSYFVGLDPGRTYVASAYHGDTNNSGKSRCIQVSTKEIRQDSRVTDVKKWNLRLRKQFTGYQNMIASLPSLKTASLDVYKERVRQTLVHASDLFGFSRAHGFRRQRFKVARHSKMALVNAVKKILDGKDPKETMVGFGNWSQRNGILKGSEPAPVKKLRRELKKRGAKVVLIDEFRTSKCCSGCSTSLCENVSYMNKKGNNVKCHQVVRCLNNECSTYWQRDVNGSRNIRSLLMALVNGEERPSALCRGSRFTEAGKLHMQVNTS